MDSNSVLALANKYQEAADEVRKSAHNLKNALNLLSSDWSGKGRDQFNSEFEETLQVLEKHAVDCLETCSDLRTAAGEIEKINEEKRRLAELEKQSLLNEKILKNKFLLS